MDMERQTKPREPNRESGAGRKKTTLEKGGGGK